MFTKGPLTIFTPLLGNPQPILETKKFIEHQTKEQYPLLYNIELDYPYSPNQSKSHIKALEELNPEHKKLHIVSGSNEDHEATFYLVDYIASKINDLVYVHIDSHPDASPMPKKMQGNFITHGTPNRSFSLGTFVHAIQDLESVEKIVMLGYHRIPENNYDPKIFYDHVYGPSGITSEKDFETIFTGKNVYVTIDGDGLKDWKGFMEGGKMTKANLKRNLESIASVANIAAIDMTGFCKTIREFQSEAIQLGEARLNESQIGLTCEVLEMTNDILYNNSK